MTVAPAAISSNEISMKPRIKGGSGGAAGPEKWDCDRMVEAKVG